MKIYFSHHGHLIGQFKVECVTLLSSMFWSFGNLSPHENDLT